MKLWASSTLATYEMNTFNNFLTVIPYEMSPYLVHDVSFVDSWHSVKMLRVVTHVHLFSPVQVLMLKL